VKPAPATPAPSGAAVESTVPDSVS
jgi:hypothetical protein